MSDTARAAVVTVTHNSSAVLEAWLNSLEASPYRSELELCVVDAGSQDGEREAMREMCAGRAEHFLAVPNLGFGRATNIGVSTTSAPVVILLNPDATLEELPADLLDPAQVGGRIVGPVLVDGRPTVFAHAPTAWWEATSLVFGRHAGTYERTFEGAAYASGGCMLMTREAFDRLGGFSSELFLFFEDADLGLRHVAEGRRIDVDPRWVVDHVGPKGSGGLWRNDALDGLARQSARRLTARHQGRAAAGLLWILLALVYVPRRVLAEVQRGEHGPGGLAEIALDLLLPGRTMRRLQAVPPDPVSRWSPR